MPCGKRPLVKSWDKPRDLRGVKPSRYQQNEASVKVHWKNVIKDLELSYKDEQFWESQSETVRGLVGPIIFERLVKIFNLPEEGTIYEPKSETSVLTASEEYYTMKRMESSAVQPRGAFSYTDYEPSMEEEHVKEEQSEQWSVSSQATADAATKKISRIKSLTARSSKSMGGIKSISRVMSKSMARLSRRSFGAYRPSKSTNDTTVETETFTVESASSGDDLSVHATSITKRKHRHSSNPHFKLLYCNESETDMIKWNSKYKQKSFEVSASDEYSKKAKIITKQIALDFFEWWVGLGNVEFKSEIKRPEDIEALFQVWFDEHASRGLVLEPKILPCVLQSIANAVGAPKTACPKVLKRQIAFDIKAETSPAHTMAFRRCLPLKMKHIPPKNNTKETWHSVRIPEDLRTMACVWEDIQHLTSTKAFQKWLQQRPFMSMPEILKEIDMPGEKKQLFVVPSDFVVRDKSMESFSSSQELAIPISQFSFEIKEVLSKLMND